MRRSRNEVARWRMLRQSQRRKQRWLERQSCRNRHTIRVCRRLEDQHRRALLFVVAYEW
ncbi:chpB toxin of the ChpB-ChpS toxin-antitoxin system [Serratia sp. S1B]|nr:chpB toxin of the ChpB-ChpS toxin-antitoxin system [Serratia sp. S1B]